MKISVMSRKFFCGMLMSLVASIPSLAYGDKAKPTSVKSPAKPEVTEVEMFAAMKAGEIEVKLIAKDSTVGNVLIKNKTNKPLSIKLPDAFVGVPVAAQFGGGGMGGGGMGGMGGGGMGGGGGNQAMGGGMGGGGMGGMGGGGMGGGGFGGGGMGGGGGFFKVEPEKVGKIKIAGVCLEHGKADPNPHITYEIRPIETFTTKPEVIELMKMLGRGNIDQRSAQAATWHLQNGKSWQELTTKIGAKHLDGSTEAYFTNDQLKKGFAYAQEAGRRAEETALKTPNSKVNSQSQQ